MIFCFSEIENLPNFIGQAGISGEQSVVAVQPGRFFVETTSAQVGIMRLHTGD